MRISHTVDLVELVWTVVSLVGLALALDLLEQATYDRRVVRSSRPVAASADRRLAAIDLALRQWRLECEIVASDVAAAWWIVAQEIVSLAIGVVALTTPNPPGGRTSLGWAVVVGLLLLAGMLPARLFGQRRRRRRLGVAIARSDRPQD